MWNWLGTTSLTFGRPWWLILIPVLLPPIVLFSLRSLSGLGRFRQTLAIGLRTGVVSLLVLALAELQVVRRNDSLTTIFLIDASQSIPNDWVNASQSFVKQAITAHKRPGDQAGVIVFGKDAKVDSPPTTYDAAFDAITANVDPEYTDVASALKLALATFPNETAKRIVVISDGNANRGNAYEQALAAAGLKVQVDVLPVEYKYDREVLIERIALPPDVKKGETVNIGVVVRASSPARGKLRITQEVEGSKVELDSIDVNLERGVNVFNLKQTINEPNFYAYKAEFVPDPGDVVVKTADREANNYADGFTQYRGEASVLLIEGRRGEHAELVQALREKQIAVTALAAGEVGEQGEEGGDPLPTDLAGFQRYDAVILANVPKDAFTEQQQELLETIVHDQGIGLVMVGGDKSFGAGGWLGSPVEKALPVNMQIPSMKVQGKAAMVMIMHASEIPEGNYWQAQVAKEALKTLSSYDYAGLVHWQGQEAWLFPLREIGTSKNSMLRAIDRMAPGDMPDFDPSIQMALKGLQSKTDAMSKHIIVISDGDPTPPTAAIIRQLTNAKPPITVTTVLTAAHGNDPGAANVMQQLARQTKGRFYNVQNPKALPRIYQKEARLISRPLIYEGPPKPSWAVALAYQSEPLLGLPDQIPPIAGYVQTSLKENELVEAPLLSPYPQGQTNPVLAHWTYGLGRSVAFTSDSGRKWTPAWRDWSSYSAFWSQVVRWAMRPVDKGNLTVSLRREEGRIKVVVDALDKDNQFLNFLQMQANVNKPGGAGDEKVDLVQVAPGKYEGTVEQAEARGNYFITLGYRGPDNTQGVVTTGLAVPYSDEYRELQSNPVALQVLADATGGQTLEWRTQKNPRDGKETPDVAATVRQADVFRRDRGTPPPRSFQDLWPTLLWWAMVLFLADVGVRRVAPDFDRIRRKVVDSWTKLRGREVAPRVEYMEKLRSRKAEVGQQIDKTRGATRFEPPPVSMPTSSAPIGEPLLEGETVRNEALRSARPATPGLAPDPASPKPVEPESYTNRLLKAKQKVWEERDKDKPNG